MRSPRPLWRAIAVALLIAGLAVIGYPRRSLPPAARFPAADEALAGTCQRVSRFVTQIDFHLIKPNGASDSPGLACVPDRVELFSLSGEGIANRLLNTPGRCAQGLRDASPWVLLEAANPNLGRAAYLVQLTLARRMYESSIQQELEYESDSDAVEHVLKQSIDDPPPPVPLQDVVQAIHDQIQDKTDIDSVKQTFAGFLSNLLCDPYRASRCPDAFKEILARFDTVSTNFGALLAMPWLLRQILSDPAYAKGAELAALKLMSRVRDAEAGAGVSGDFFSDLRDGYLQAGLSEPEATRRAWDIAGFYGVRGASMNMLGAIFKRGNGPIGVALYVLSAAMGYLDADTVGTPHRYAFPPEVRTTCAYGKPYHFWMSAYLARLASAKGQDLQSIASAVHLAGLGYEYSSDTWGRDSGLLSGIADRDSDYLNSVRMNIVFNDAGAIYGARAALGEAQRPLLIDDALSALIRSWKAPNGGENFLSWRERFGADWAYYSLEGMCLVDDSDL